jgi:hypothetical protein
LVLACNLFQFGCVFREGLPVGLRAWGMGVGAVGGMMQCLQPRTSGVAVAFGLGLFLGVGGGGN